MCIALSGTCPKAEGIVGWEGIGDAPKIAAPVVALLVLLEPSDITVVLNISSRSLSAA